MLQFINDRKEKENILASTIYSKNYTMEEIVNNKAYKKYIIAVLDDGSYVFYNLPQEIIQTTLWYDDEGDGIDSDEKNFIHYNISDKYELDKMRRYAIFKNPFGECHIKSSSWGYYNETLTRYLEREEQQQLQEELNKVKEAFIKRLKTYWKKYNYKVRASGYWANR